MRRRAIAVTFACVLLAACAAEKASQSPATSAPPRMAPPDADQSGVGPEPHAVTRESARSEIKQAEIELTQAGSDCSRACKALASMERATAHLCSVVSTPDDQHSCDDARQKLQSSRDRVRSTCGECTH